MRNAPDMSNAIRVVIVDDDVPTRVGLRTILEADHDIVVIDESADANDAYSKVSALRPDVVLMDVQLQGADGISLTERILRDLGDGAGTPRVIVLTTFALDEYAYRSLRAGA